MISHSSTYTKLAILLLYLLQTIHCRPQDTEANGSPINPLRNGRYIPELHGADRGKYIPDESGKYHHVKVPYNGGYGDRGQMYVHDARGLPLHQFGTLNGFQLGPKDHLRFSVDFNFDGSGWQIVQFEWINDDDVKKHYDYKYENQLWPSDYDVNADVNADANADVEATATEKPEEGDTTNVHVSGEYQDDIYNVKYTNDNELNAPSQFNIQATISDVLDYVQTNVLPTLT